MNGPAAGAMNTADVAGPVRSELTAAGIRRQRCGRDGFSERECYVILAARCARGH